jgi:hypothetical protein
MSSTIAQVDDSKRSFANSGIEHITKMRTRNTFFDRSYVLVVAPETIRNATQIATQTEQQALFERDIKGAVDVLFATAQRASFAESDRPNQYALVVSPEVANESNEAAKQAASQYPNFERKIEKAVNAFFDSAVAKKALEIADKAPQQALSEIDIKGAADIAVSTAKASFFYPTMDDHASADQQEAAMDLAIPSSPKVR